MVFKITGGIGLILMGITLLGLAVPTILTGIFITIAGVALLAGM